MKLKNKVGIMLMEDFFRETVEPRRRQEQRDSDMVKYNYSAVSNLSQEPIYRTFRPGFKVERLRNDGNEE
jgi:hypothetical protein